MTMPELSPAIDEYPQPLVVDGDKLHHFARSFAQIYRKLAIESEDQFLPTPIDALPSGDERGRFLAIDVGVSDLRVGFVELFGHAGHDALDREPNPPRHQKIFEKAWPIGEHLRNEHADDLFAWIG